MGYALENKNETARLEKQSQTSLYSVDDELRGINCLQGEIILDAGCGSGILSRHLENNFSSLSIEACDISELRVQQAKSFAPESKVKYFASSIDKLPRESDTYHKVFSRYVFEHLENPLNAMKELYRVVKKNGEVIIIDADGIIFDLCTSNSFVNECLEEIKTNFKFNMYIGRKLPSLMKEAGFKNITWHLSPMVFQGEALLEEFKLNQQRFSFIAPELAKFLGENKTERFVEEYLSEMMKPESVLFYNKFIVKGTK